MAAEEKKADNLMEAEKLAHSLTDALSGGDSNTAVELCKRLSQLSLPVCVSIKRQAYHQQNIRLRVGIEDGQSDAYIPVILNVSPCTTIAQLKEKVSQEYGFHPLLQHWVIGKRLAQDRETLQNHSIRQDGDQAFLFIRSAQAAHLTRHQHNIDQTQQLIENIVETMGAVNICPRGPTTGKKTHSAAPPAPPPKVPAAPKPPMAPKPQLGWTCTACTFLNKPTRPGCEICGEAPPEDYKVPDMYEPDQQEALRLEQEQMSLWVYEKVQQEEREMNYMRLLETDDQNLILNVTESDCPICLSLIGPGEGIILRECLHTFCRDCLHDMILASREAEVSCPDACDSKLLDREIKELLTEEEHQRFLELRLIVAETCMDNSFHCQTPNCRGWCVYEDEVNEFPCELCDKTNCILCRAIHTGMNCKDYQDDLRLRAQNDLAAQKTKQMLDNMLQNGEAMKCPRCEVIVQKKDGCDWICCMMCKTEICWVTKQARWGPNGNGDTSGGCRCRVNNKLCHPNCTFCH